MSGSEQMHHLFGWGAGGGKPDGRTESRRKRFALKEMPTQPGLPQLP